MFYRQNSRNYLSRGPKSNSCLEFLIFTRACGSIQCAVSGNSGWHNTVKHIHAMFHCKENFHGATHTHHVPAVFQREATGA
jgi:hypothetical protein